jgi:hypothetical protein
MLPLKIVLTFSAPKYSDNNDNKPKTSTKDDVTSTDNKPKTSTTADELFIETPVDTPIKFNLKAGDPDPAKKLFWFLPRNLLITGYYCLRILKRVRELILGRKDLKVPIALNTKLRLRLMKK